MRVLVWQWGRRGAGPRIAASLAEGFAALDGTRGLLAVSAGAEILDGPDAPGCAFTLPVYRSTFGFLLRVIAAPAVILALARRLGRVRPSFAVCAMPGPLDLLMAAALRVRRIPFAVVVHDAQAHPGDGYPFQHRLNRALIRRADAVVVMSGHVADALRAQAVLRPGKPLIRASHPSFAFTPTRPVRPRGGGTTHLLSFGRLLPYKGLDLLAEALIQIGPPAGLEVRVVGHGPQSEALDRLRTIPGVSVENRWVPEAELGDLIAWADLMVLPYREASQSGVAAAALAQGKRVLATRVGGLEEQLGREPLARLCEPDAPSLAGALAELLRTPPPADITFRDASAEWRDFAARIVEGWEGARPNG